MERFFFVHSSFYLRMFVEIFVQTLTNTILELGWSDWTLFSIWVRCCDFGNVSPKNRTILLHAVMSYEASCCIMNSYDVGNVSQKHVTFTLQEYKAHGHFNGESCEKRAF